MSVSPDGAGTLPMRPHILIVEDNPDTCILMEQILEDFGEITITSDPQEALSLASETDFDLVILDINLGASMSGSDVMQELRTRPSYAHTPILALTAYALPGDRERFIEMGFTSYMSKPFEIEELLDLTRRLLQEGTSTPQSGVAG